MSVNGHDPKLSDAVADVLAEHGASPDGPRPQEFDTHGFPVPQPKTSFVQRVARLLDPRLEGDAR